MTMRSALHSNRVLALCLLASLTTTTAAWAVPLDDQPSHPFDRVTLLQAPPGEVLKNFRAPDNKPIFIHGSTNVTMGYITVQQGDGCSGFSRTQSFVHGPTNITMGYIAVQSGNDCIYSGSTDQKEVALLATKAEKARRSITKSFAQTGRTGGGTNGTDGGDGDSTGGGTSSTSGGPGGGGGGGNPGGGNPGGGGNLSPVPLPATLPLLAIAVAGLASLRRRKPETA